MNEVTKLINGLFLCAGLGSCRFNESYYVIHSLVYFRFFVFFLGILNEDV